MEGDGRCARTLGGRTRINGLAADDGSRGLQCRGGFGGRQRQESGHGGRKPGCRMVAGSVGSVGSHNLTDWNGCRVGQHTAIF